MWDLVKLRFLHIYSAALKVNLSSKESVVSGLSGRPLTDFNKVGLNRCLFLSIDIFPQ